MKWTPIKIYLNSKKYPNETETTIRIVTERHTEHTDGEHPDGRREGETEDTFYIHTYDDGSFSLTGEQIAYMMARCNESLNKREEKQ